ncbi:CBU_0592 family membrane protein [Corynebacterium uberis]|uniref:CBU_0592 family membrane protein n=1 Tax=Corynebacterium TaxID=1716 RepID=UPI001D0A208B|nr:MULTISPECIES: transporter [Corynebacterium]MCZ9309026.1 transporter [Corynebacterium sp. c6VSa_13]UDL74507.1 transporter [Corynebacterium uberis]UDL76658.1 transporter [Corynebacterium uberis]UDL78871.1 transporter [Corynebacterium uberis]UDL81149.1 transporter [Corynebacterium uberis]
MPFAAPISIVASVALLAGFALLNMGKLTPDHYTYQWLNAIGAAALTYSAIQPFNVGVVITEAIWTLIALFGVVKIWRKRSKGAPAPAAA